jgi:hypothetical protein
MKKCSLIPYPSEIDIRYAHWLKHFATQLPAYRRHYALTRFQVLQMQCMALDFLDLLVRHTQWATASIERRWQFTLRLQRELADQLTNSRLLIQEKVTLVVASIQQHPGYSEADGDVLQLLLQEQLISEPAGVTAPATTSSL